MVVEIWEENDETEDVGRKEEVWEVEIEEGEELIWWWRRLILKKKKIKMVVGCENCRRWREIDVVVVAVVMVRRPWGRRPGQRHEGSAEGGWWGMMKVVVVT